MSNAFELLNNNRIVVPMIQRDYAYGRDSEQEKVKRFIDTIFEVLSGEKDNLRLNYIYGVPNHIQNQIVLIDGQQRTTTLYLIRLFLSINAGISIDQFKDNLTYATRTTSKEFCEFLSRNSNILLCDNDSVSKKLDNHKSFYKKWRNDPTVFSMINVLELISEKCKGLTTNQYREYIYNLKRITFEFIRLDGFKREESLYTTMNGRGKQLTTFEVVKSSLFGLLKDYDPEIENTINNKWIPTFWEYTLSTSNNDWEYTADNHDRYLYNYLKYIMSMIWYENNQIDKQKKLAPFEKILEWMSNNKDQCELILFAMNHFKDWSVDSVFNQYLVVNNCHDTRTPDKTNVFWDNVNLDFIKTCCEQDELEKTNLLSRSLLWAFIVYKYKENKRQLNNKTLKDYLVLMRDIYAASWDSNTPTGITKNPTEHLVARGISAFRHIVNNDSVGYDDYRTQKDTYEADNQIKYVILNNYCTRGCSNNLAEIIQQKGVSNDQAQLFADNLDFLLNHIGVDNVAALEDIGINPYFINAQNNKLINKNRFYLPCTKYMLQSLFSMKSWTEKDNGWYKGFINKLSNNKLKESSKAYTSNDWQYYFKKYDPCFVFKGSLGAFDYVKDSNGNPILFEIFALSGLKASSRQITQPYILAAYHKRNPDKPINKNLIVECERYISNNGISLKVENNGFLFTNGGQVSKIQLGGEIVEEISNLL